MVAIVDLPHPVGPTTAQNSPVPIVRSSSRTAVWTPPLGVRNRLVTPRSSMLPRILETRLPWSPVRSVAGYVATDVRDSGR